MRLVRDYPFLGEARARRFASSYGSLCLRFLHGMTHEAQLGDTFGAGLTQAEVDYLVRDEWARSTDDILWRRTKLGLRLDAAQQERLTTYLERHRREHAA